MRPATPTGRLLVLSATAALSVALLAGCGDDNDDPETAPTDSQSSTSEPTEPSTQPSSTSTSTPETTEPVTEKDRAVEAASQRVEDFTTFRDELLGDPRAADLTEQRLGAYLQNPELTAQLTYLTGFRDQGFTTNGGSTTFEWIKATKVQLFPDKNDAAVSLRACYNYDDVVTYDKKGDNAAPDQISPGIANYEVYNYDYPSPDGWHIAVENIPGKGCK